MDKELIKKEQTTNASTKTYFDKPDFEDEIKTSDEIKSHGLLDLQNQPPFCLTNDKWIDQEAKLSEVILKTSCKELFNDPFFIDMLGEASLLSTKWQRLKWQRPKELVAEPVLGVDSTSYKEIVQGHIDNCALASSLSTISRDPTILQQIFGREAELSGSSYTGSVQINLWLTDRWTAVYIDDRLPCLDGKLLGMASTNTNHFWAALLEKAFAK